MKKYPFLNTLLVISIIFITSVSLFGFNLKSKNSNLHFETISIEEGLSQSIILCILQDHNGFLWIGTQDGLNKYDGYNFKYYLHNPQNTQSVSSNYIKSLYEDSDHNLWIGTNNGLDKFDLTTEKFSHYLNGELINDIVEDSNRKLWLGTINSGLKILNTATGKIETYDAHSKIITDRISKLFIDKNILWIGTENGLSVLDIAAGKIKILELFNDKNIRSLLVDSSNNLWVGTDRIGVIKIRNQSDIFNFQKINYKQFINNPNDKNSISGNSINSICQTQSGTLWFGVWGGGISKLEASDSNGKELFSRYLRDDSNPFSIGENDINVIIEDNSGIIWIGTYGGGLNKINPNNLNFKTFVHTPNKNNSLVDDRVFAIYQNNPNSLWVGTWSGLDKINLKNGNYKHFKHDASFKYSLSNSRVTAITEDGLGYIWIGTLDGGLNKLNEATNEITRVNNFFGNQKSNSDNQITSLLLSKKGVIWIGTLGSGLSTLNPKTNRISKIDISKNGFSSLTNTNIKSLFEDKSGNIWIGTYKGLNMYSSIEKIINNYQNGYIDNPILQKKRITSINQTSDGYLWIGTLGDGVVRIILDADNKIISEKEFHTIDGLPDENIYSILIDKNNSVWVSTNHGIAELKNGANHFISYGSFEGLTLDEFNEGAFYNKNTGVAFLGGINGLIQFNPSNLSVNYGSDKIAVTGFKIDNKDVSVNLNSVLKSAIEETKLIELNYKQNSISFQFTSLNFIHPNSTKYFYKLEGYDDSFVETDAKNRKASYSNLPNGKYKFIVKSMVSGAYNRSAEKKIFITISPPFWKATWFMYSLSLFFLVGVPLIFIARTHRIQKRNLWLTEQVKLRTSKLEKINETKDRFVSIIAHDLKGPFGYLLNNSNLLMESNNFLSDSEKNELISNINISANNLSNLLENLLQWSQLQIAGIKPNLAKVNLSSLLTNNINLVKFLAINKKIKLASSCKNSMMITTDINMLNTIIRNLLINSIKFTKANGEINIIAKKLNSEIEIIISDSGVGMKESVAKYLFLNKTNVSTTGTNSEKGTGLGLLICKDFVESLNGIINVESTEGKGTTIICKFPV